MSLEWTPLEEQPTSPINGAHDSAGTSYIVRKAVTGRDCAAHKLLIEKHDISTRSRKQGDTDPSSFSSCARWPRHIWSQLSLSQEGSQQVTKVLTD
jgi:hypothetical protein